MFDELKSALQGMSWKEVMDLALASRVPFHTIAKIKRGETTNPKIQTVESLMEHIRRSAVQ